MKKTIIASNVVVIILIFLAILFGMFAREGIHVPIPIYPQETSSIDITYYDQAERPWCLAASTLMILDYWEVTRLPSIRELADQLYIKGYVISGDLIGACKDIVETHDLSFNLYLTTDFEEGILRIKSDISNKEPVIAVMFGNLTNTPVDNLGNPVTLEQLHAVVVVGYNASGVFFHNPWPYTQDSSWMVQHGWIPEGPNTFLSFDQFKRAWTIYGIGERYDYSTGRLKLYDYLLLEAWDSSYPEPGQYIFTTKIIKGYSMWPAVFSVGVLEFAIINLIFLATWVFRETPSPISVPKRALKAYLGVIPLFVGCTFLLFNFYFAEVLTGFSLPMMFVELFALTIFLPIGAAFIVYGVYRLLHDVLNMKVGRAITALGIGLFMAVFLQMIIREVLPDFWLQIVDLTFSDATITMPSLKTILNLEIILTIEGLSFVIIGTVQITRGVARFFRYVSCIQCGYKLSRGAAFCPNCGASTLDRIKNIEGQNTHSISAREREKD